MKLSCPECGTTISGDNINIQTHSAVCQECGNVFKFQIPDEKAKTKRQPIKKPDNFDVKQEDDTLHLAFRQPLYLLGLRFERLTFLIIWVAYLFVMALIFKALGIFAPGGLLIGGIAVMYTWAVAGLVNRIHIRMMPGIITVSSEPLPVFQKHQQIRADKISRFRIRETERSKKRKSKISYYDLYAQIVDGEHELVVSNLQKDYAYYTAQTLQKHLQRTKSSIKNKAKA